MKKVLVFVVAFAIGIGIALSVTTLVNHFSNYYVEQYVFDHGLKITIDRNRCKTRDNGKMEYLGCYNYRGEAVFVYMADDEWKETLFSYDNDYESKKEVKTEWRW